MRAVQSERLIDVHRASKRLGLAPRTVRKLAGSGLLPAVREGKKLWKFRPSDVEEFKQCHAQSIKPRRRFCKGGIYACA